MVIGGLGFVIEGDKALLFLDEGYKECAETTDQKRSDENYVELDNCFPNLKSHT